MLVLSSLASATPQGHATVDASAIFKPLHFVPLSEFGVKSGTTITLHVDKSILTWTKNRNEPLGFAIRSSSGALSIGALPGPINDTIEEVTIDSPLLGSVVVVQQSLLQHLLTGDSAIVTHWNPNLNPVAGGAPRGGQEEGANGGMTNGLGLRISDGEIEPVSDACAPKSYANSNKYRTNQFTVCDAEDLIKMSSRAPERKARVQFSSSGTLPGGLSLDTDYYTFGDPSDCANTRIATSLANADAGVFVDITSEGTGIHKLTNLDYWGHADNSIGAYQFASNKLALFSDGTGAFDGPDTVTPSLERYIGENYSPVPVSSLAAIALSDLVREMTGFPIAHRQHDAFTTTPPIKGRVTNDLPVFQLVNGFIVDYVDPSIVGSEQSIASFILPPGWTGTAGSYPIVLYSHYDLNGAVYLDRGRELFYSIGALANELPSGRLAVGVVWNAGAAAAGFSLQPSLEHSAIRLFDDMADKLRGDRHRILAFGDSRGGIAALRLAGNPSNPCVLPHYTVLWAAASAPLVRIGTSIETANQTFALGLESLQGTTGYVDAPREGWKEPDVGLPRRTGRQLSAYNQLGESDFATIDGELSIDSPSMIAAMACSGASIVLRNGTHDYVAPVCYSIEYARRLRSAGVNVELEVYYRHGHATLGEDGPSVQALLQRVFDNAPATSSSVQQFSTNPANFSASDPFPTSIPFQPLTVQLPLASTYEGPPELEGSQVWCFTGEPGSRVVVQVRPLDPDWSYGQEPVYTGPFTQLLETYIDPAAPGDPFGIKVLGSFNPGLPEGKWWYRVGYDVDPNNPPLYDMNLGLGDVAAPEFYLTSNFSASTSDVLTLSSVPNGIHPFARVRVTSTGTLPLGLELERDYYVIQIDAASCNLAISRGDALNGVSVDVTSGGIGTHSMLTIIEPVIEVYNLQHTGRGAVGRTGGVSGDTRL